MSNETSIDGIASALDDFRAGLAADRLAHAYLVLGPPRGTGGALASNLLQILFCDADCKPCGVCSGCRRVHDRTHPDVGWIEPESKSRQILAEVIRDVVLPRIQQKSFEGGWKAIVILQADRLNTAAANIMLKTLEEPPPRSLLLLVTDTPQNLLPTIVSRCQKFRLVSGRGTAADAWRDRVEAILATHRPDALGSLATAARLQAILDEIADQAAKELKEELKEEDIEKDVRDARIGSRVREIRAGVLQILMEWHRDILILALGQRDAVNRTGEIRRALERQAEGTSATAALANLGALENLNRRLELNLNPMNAFDAFLRSAG